jgi:hypothetical protein
MEKIVPGTNQDCDTNNIRDFYTNYMSNSQFQRKFLCARLYAPESEIRLKSMGDEDCDIQIKMKKILLQNPNFKHKCGLLNLVELEIKAPLDKKLVSNFCNYELRIQVQDGIFDLNRKFMQKIINFFVFLDALLTVIKGIRKLVLK